MLSLDFPPSYTVATSYTVMEVVQRYVLNSSVQLSSFDISGGGPRYLVEVDDGRFEVSERLHQIIRLLEQGVGTAEGLAEELRTSGLPQTSAQGIRAVMRQILIPRNIVRDCEDNAPATVPVRVKRSHLSLQLPIVKPETIRPLTTILQVLFRKPIFITLLLISAAAHIYFYSLVFPGFSWSFTALSPADYIIILVILNITTIFHELGHASACRFYNCPHGKIGWGIYLYMFVLYTDVSSTWKLQRKQRALVDVAGMYFELIAAILVAALMLFRPNQVYVYVFVLLDLSILYSFNPVLKRDGYWLMSDLAGVANLRDLSIEALRCLAAKRLRGQQTVQSPRLLALPQKTRIALYAYAAISVTFFFGLVYWLGTQLVREIIPGYPRTLRGLGQALTTIPVDYRGVFSTSIRLALLTLFAAVLALALTRLLRFAYRAVTTLARADIPVTPI